MSKYKAIIYDLDGLLIDSMYYWVKADTEFLGQFGISLTHEMIRLFNGRSEEENMIWLKREYNLEESVAELLDRRSILIDKIYTTQTKPMPAADELLNSIQKTNMRQAIASGSPYNHIKIVCDRFDWRRYFEQLVSSDHVGKIGKPNPAVYLFAADQLRLKPAECLVFEDAENGLVAAKKAGMDCVVVPNENWSFGDFTSADLIVDSLADKKIRDLLNI